MLLIYNLYVLYITYVINVIHMNSTKRGIKAQGKKQFCLNELKKASRRRYILTVPRRVSTILPVEEIAEGNGLVITILTLTPK